MVLGFGLGREGQGLWGCCCYTQLKLESRGSVGFVRSPVTQPMAEVKFGPVTLTLSMTWVFLHVPRTPPSGAG